jgi:hypothetical protein
MKRSAHGQAPNIRYHQLLGQRYRQGAQLNVNDDAIEQGAGFSPADAAATQPEVRSRPITRDYYSVLVRAVSDLPNNTREARQALYDRAEVALAAELLQDPQVSEAQVADERLAFERAIRIVERETRKKVHDDQEECHGHYSTFRSFFRLFQRS